MKKIKISRRATRVPRLKEALCIISRSLRSRRVGSSGEKESKNKKNKKVGEGEDGRVEARDLIAELYPTFSIRAAFRYCTKRRGGHRLRSFINVR